MTTGRQSPKSGRLCLVVFVAMLIAVASCGDDDEPIDDSFDRGYATITDTDSGLMWLANADNGSMTWDDAMVWADGLHVGGFDDWRLPSGENDDGSVCNSQSPPGGNCTETEFATLYHARTITSLSVDPFAGIGTVYWTATEAPGDPSEAMTQDMMDGGQNPFDKTRSMRVWAVRTVTDTDEIALEVSGETVIDRVQCLTWTKDANVYCSMGEGLDPRGECWIGSLQRAEEWAESLDYAGSDEWRLSQDGFLQDESELETLFYETLGNPPGGPLTIFGPFENVLQETGLTFADAAGQMVTEQRMHADYWITASADPTGREPTFNIADQTYADHFMTDGERFSAWAVLDSCDE